MQRFFTNFIEDITTQMPNFREMDNSEYIILLEYYPEYLNINYEDYGAEWQCLQNINKEYKTKNL